MSIRKECFHDASRLLKPKGVMSVIFYYLTWWQLARIYHSVENGYGSQPIGVYSHADNGPTLLVGPGVEPESVKQKGLRMFSVEEAAKNFMFDAGEWKGVNATTDDWPYVFLRSPGVTWNYAFGLFFTLALGVGLVRKAFGSFTTNSSGRLMFFLGAAFMLIETKSVTQMGLLAGTTWVVNSAVITGVLLMILIANLIQIRFRFKNLNVLFALLAVSIVANYFFDLSLLNGLPTTASIAVGSLILSSATALCRDDLRHLVQPRPRPEQGPRHEFARHIDRRRLRVSLDDARRQGAQLDRPGALWIGLLFCPQGHSRKYGQRRNLCGSPAGRVNQNTDPLLSWIALFSPETLSTPTRPSCASMISLQIASPRPKP